MTIGRPRSGESRSVSLACTQCGGTFRRKLSQIERRPTAIYSCSPACKNRGRRDQWAARFWGHVARGGAAECWPWTANIVRRYGHFSFNGRSMKAHRFAYQITKGEIPPGMVIMHRCDNPSCVNPAHLEVGTFAENTQDMHFKGRNADRKGERHPLRKLCASQIIEIRGRRETNASLAAEYGVSRGQIYRIKSGKNWSHL